MDIAKLLLHIHMGPIVCPEIYVHQIRRIRIYPLHLLEQIICLGKITARPKKKMAMNFHAITDLL